MHAVTLSAGESVPCFGLGTWQLGDDPKMRAEEIATLRLGLDLGATLIDTAEMYGEGRSEELIGEAIEGRRAEVFLVTKVLPSHASERGCIEACERSLRRLRTDHIDLYLLHWPGQVPLAQTLAGFLALQRAGKIRHFGVSNFDVADLEAFSSLQGGSGIAANQLLYNLTRRGIESRVLPWLRARGIPVMAYSPIEQSRLLRNKKLLGFAQRHARTPAQAALAWLLTRKDVIVIPKTGSRARLRENIGALEKPLTAAETTELESLFPAPKRAGALQTL
jgi:diketogulonate reductase-like aldo/keto reductase